jgi:outer membrane biosynthesis protein TonB
MTRGRAALVVLISSLAATAHAQSMTFTPPRFLKGVLAPLPPPTVVGGGEVLIEATVDRTGRLTRPIIIRGTAPYTQMVLDAVAGWRFDPARAAGPDGREDAVDAPIAIAAVYRPPILLNAPTLGEAPNEWSRPSSEVAYPLSMATPNSPPQARDSGVVLLEVTLNEAGRIAGTRGIDSTGGFEGAAQAAIASWTFRGASYRARPVPASVYVFFGFQSPVAPPPPRPVPQR